MSWFSFLQPWFSWILALHVLSFVSWMAGLLYLPRLFVYHCQVSESEGEAYERFCVMERKLLRQIMNPAMCVACAAGLLMSVIPGVVDWSAWWWWVKLGCVTGLVGFQHSCYAWRKQFAAGTSRHSEKYFRIANEIPTVLMIITVIMIVVRP